MQEVELLELAQEVPVLGAGIKQYLQLGRNDDPLNVPIDQLDWRRANVQVLDDDNHVSDEISTSIVELKTAVVGVDQEGNKFLARKGDYLIRNGDTYRLLRRV